MPLNQWFRPPRHLLTLFVAGTVAASAALAWLGWRLVDQERVVAAQHVRERLEGGADRAAAIFERNLHQLEEQLSSSGDSLPDHTVLLSGSWRTLQVRPAGRLVFYPPLTTAEGAPVAAFRAAEAARVAAAYRELARSADASVKAGALLRLGRTLRKAGLSREALQVYAELEPFGTMMVSGLSAGLVAREARCSVLEAMGRRDDLAREARILYADLETGRYPLQRASWTFFSEEAKAWAGPEAVRPPGLDDAIALSSAAESFRSLGQELPASGQKLELYESQPVLAVWKSAPDRFTVLLAGRRYLEAISLQAAREAGVSISLSDRDGAPILGAASGPVAVRSAPSIHQPWNLYVSSADPAAESLQDVVRHRLLLSGLVITGILILASGYFTFRGIHRELAVAQLQSDFVSAVSHEFRTPLTSMRQLSQMLSHGRVIHEDRRQQYYDVLMRESERLHRLVEGLLNFSRMEAGAKPYRLEPVEANEVVQSVTAEFARQAKDCTVEVSPTESPCIIRADREALSLALWNLLDNAQKYSPECRTIWVTVVREGRQIGIAVRDQGAGVPPDEQRRIFRKFVRGAGTVGAGVQGAGIGLAMVRTIIQAHGGDVRLESTVGRGSTFTLALPLENTT
jgi:signal transduction histidine kinase